MEVSQMFFGRPEALRYAGPMMRALGIPLLELMHAHFNCTDPHEMALLRRELDRAGVRVHSVHAPFGPQLSIGSADEGLRRHALAAHEVVMRAAARMGARVVVVHPGYEVGGEEDLRRCQDTVRASLERLLPLAEQLDLRLAVENMLPAHTLSRHEDLLECVARVDHPRVGICLDTGHAHVVDSVERAIEVFGALIIHVHLHDNDGTADQHLLPPRGTIGWNGFLAQLGSVGFQGPLTIEAKKPDEYTMRDMIEEVRWVLRMGDS